jgi:DNA-binding response OmpR family regulator
MNLQKNNILIIEDLEPVYDTYRDIIVDHYKNTYISPVIDIVTSLKDFNKRNLKKKYDVILTDWALPDGTAAEIMPKLKEMSDSIYLLTGCIEMIQNNHKKMIKNIKIEEKPINVKTLVSFMPKR